MIYSLPSLGRENPADVEGILASLTLAMLPSPGISSEESGIPSELRDRLIHEIRIKLGLKRDDKSPKAMARIYDLLAKEIGRVALANVDVNDVKFRLGERGDLPPALYKIEFTEEFKREHQRRGVDTRDVERALQAPDSVEHLHPAQLGIDTDKATSLYLKRFDNSVRPSNTFSLLVFCRRMGYVQSVGQAWMVFHSDVDISNAIKPTDVLRALVDKYGLELKVGDKTGLFFWYEKVGAPIGEKTKYLEFTPPKDLNVSLIAAQGPHSEDTLQVLFAFAINDTAYEADLATHGIKIKPPRKNTSTLFRDGSIISPA